MKVAVAVLVCAGTAAAAPGPMSLGAFVGVPGEGSGPPIGQRHVPIGVIGSYDLSTRDPLERALTVGLGVPIASVGASLWAGFELRVSPTRHLALHATPGLRTGFVGPGYYARHSDVFVGYEYIYSGPWTIAPRLPLAISTSVGRCSLYLEVLAELPLLPTPELLFGGALGVRVAL